MGRHQPAWRRQRLMTRSANKWSVVCNQSVGALIVAGVANVQDGTLLAQSSAWTTAARGFTWIAPWAAVHCSLHALRMVGEAGIAALNRTHNITWLDTITQTCRNQRSRK